MKFYAGHEWPLVQGFGTYVRGAPWHYLWRFMWAAISGSARGRWHVLSERDGSVHIVIEAPRAASHNRGSVTRG